MNSLKSLFILRILRFLSLLVVSGCLFSLGLQSELHAQEKPGTTPTKKSKAQLNEKLKTAIGWGEIEIKLTPKAPTEKIRGMWTPKAGTIGLSDSNDVLAGSLALDAFEPIKITLTVDEGGSANGSAQLKIDSNGDSKFEDSETYQIKAKALRGKFWYSSPNITISLKSREGQADSRPLLYSVTLWHVVDPNEPGEKPVLRWTRQGWHEGQFTLGDQPCTAVISDANLDGLFTDKDRWGMGETPTNARSHKNSTYAVSKHAWFDSVAYQVTSFDKNGGWLKIRAIDVGITQAEAKAKADPYAKDRKFPRSKNPFVFLHDYEEAIALAKKEDKRVVIDFVTTWCAPCGMMDRLVYTAQPISDKSKDFIFLKLDGDDEAKLGKQFKVNGYPTLILLSPDGKEISRRLGYQGVSRLLDFLKVDADK